ncbi:hypothetical protein BGW39_005597 [Mortierella sp. 14UC]|nr:hypothetical protein BGW39_005597 [Mortierella sp. 14UC]
MDRRSLRLDSIRVVRKHTGYDDDWPFQQISDTLRWAWYWQEDNDQLLKCTFENFVGKHDLLSIEGMKAYINTRRQCLNIPLSFNLGDKYITFYNVSTHKEHVYKQDIVSLPKLSGRDSQDLLDEFATIVTSDYHDDFAAVNK